MGGKKLNISILAIYASAMWLQAPHTTGGLLSPPSCSTKAIQKRLTFIVLLYSLDEKCLRIFWKKSREWTTSSSRKEKEKTERARRLGRKTRVGIEKGNHMTALRFQTGGKGDTEVSPVFLQGVKQKQFLFITHIIQ